MEKSGTNFANYNGWIFYIAKESLETTTDKELHQWKVLLEKRQQWLARRNIFYLFLIIPNKGTIYPEFMPANIYISASILAHIANVDLEDTILDSDSNIGFGFNFMAGKEWWAGEQWGLGVSLYFRYGSQTDKDVEDRTISGYSLGLCSLQRLINFLMALATSAIFILWQCEDEPSV